MTTLPDRTFAVLREVARTLFDPGPGVPERRLDWLVADLRDLFLYVGPLTRLALRMGATAVQFLPLLFIGKPRRFTRLEAGDRTRFLERLEKSLVAVLFVAVKLYLSMVWFEHPDAQREMGHDGRPLVDRERSPAARLPGEVTR